MNLLLGIPRKIQFLAAAKSARRKMIGKFIEALDCIPVERPEDVKKSGTGSIDWKTGENIILGKGTRFLAECVTGCSIYCQKKSYYVKSIESDEKLVVAESFQDSATDMKFSVIPKLDQKEGKLYDHKTSY